MVSENNVEWTQDGNPLTSPTSSTAGNGQSTCCPGTVQMAPRSGICEGLWIKEWLVSLLRQLHDSERDVPTHSLQSWKTSWQGSSSRLRVQPGLCLTTVGTHILDWGRTEGEESLMLQLLLKSSCFFSFCAHALYCPTESCLKCERKKVELKFQLNKWKDCWKWSSAPQWLWPESARSKHEGAHTWDTFPELSPRCSAT